MDKKTIFDLHRVTAAEALDAEKLPLAVVLDNIRSLNNIGSIFRTADGLGVERLLLCGITATPPSPEIHKTALGAEDSVAWSYFPSTLEAIAALREEGYTICSLEQVKGSKPLPEFRPEPGRRYAVIAGHEVHGVAQDVVDASDICLEIPQYGAKHSLNVSVSVALAIYQFRLACGG